MSSTAFTEIIRLKKHKNAQLAYEFDWSAHWLRQGGSLSPAVSDHLFEAVDADSGLTISDAAVSGNKTTCLISGGNPSSAEWRVRIAAKTTAKRRNKGVLELWITVQDD
jgi:hypothetical protein